VLSRQPADVRQFLVRTSILGRFCAPLCDTVADTAGSAEIIDRLERENLFVVALDEERRWFRYHHLFGEVLRSELGRTEPGIVPALHERASAWHRQFGSADEAIGHALAAGDVTGAIGLIARHWTGYVDSGRSATVRGWLRSLGDDHIAASPLAAHCAAWVAALAGDQASVRCWLPVVEAATDTGPLPDGMRSFRSSAALLTATFGFDGLGAMRAAGAIAVELETDPMSPWYALARTSFGVALYYSGDYEQAASQLEQAQLSHAAIALVRMLAFAVLAWLAVDTGRLAQAEVFAQNARDIVTDPDLGLGGAPQSTLAYTAVAAVHVGHGRLEEARELFEQVLRARRRWVGISIWPTVEVLFRFVPVLAELGEHAEAMRLLDEARQLLRSLPDGAGAQLARLDRLDRRLAALSPVTALDEPLTDRERDVLRLLRGTMSLREIGQELYLSQNTIKTHTRAIYRKLGVSDRHTAVLKGRDLGFM
jgi:LuxR family maltose regulon positive regulatory protein